jgi:hypothetical protein
MKKGKQDYLRAIPLAQKRRALIVQGEKQPHDIKSLGTVVH